MQGETEQGALLPAAHRIPTAFLGPLVGDPRLFPPALMAGRCSHALPRKSTGAWGEARIVSPEKVVS